MCEEKAEESLRQPDVRELYVKSTYIITLYKCGVDVEVSERHEFESRSESRSYYQRLLDMEPKFRYNETEKNPSQYMNGVHVTMCRYGKYCILATCITQWDIEVGIY